MEAHFEDKIREGEEEPANSMANPPKSPPTVPTDAPIPEVQTPGSGSGTKVDDSDVLITGSRQGPIPDPSVLVRSTPDLKPGTTTKGKETAPITTLPALSSMSTQALYEEYFSRLTQHKQLESDLVVHMQKRHQVHITFYCTLYFCTSHIILAPKHHHYNLLSLLMLANLSFQLEIFESTSPQVPGYNV